LCLLAIERKKAGTGDETSLFKEEEIEQEANSYLDSLPVKEL
jgi:hypothetical protein